jgi:purine-binding chemotaxis protein CheW
MSERPSASAGSAGRDRLQFATFFLEGQLYGIPILEVEEILLRQQVTPVPRAPSHVLGLIGLRGQIVTAVDLKKRVGLRAETRVEDPYYLVVSANGNTASVQVDSIGDVLDMPDSEFLPPPESLHGIDPAFLKGVVMLEDRILAVLDVPRVLDAG